MSEQLKKGLPCDGLGPEFIADEGRKSNLILEGNLLRAQGRVDEAAARLAEAAEIEERLGDQCEAQGLLEKASVHRFSAASCWAQAGNFYEAVVLGDALLARPDLPEALRARVQEYTQAIRRRRSEWASTLTIAGTGN